MKKALCFYAGSFFLLISLQTSEERKLLFFAYALNEKIQVLLV